MSFIQITIHGWPRKETDEITRMLFSTEDETSKAIATDLMVHYGGLFRVDSVLVAEKPERDYSEIARAHTIISQHQGNREH